MILLILLSILAGFVIGYLTAGVVGRRIIRITVLALLHILHAPHLDIAKNIAYNALVETGTEYKVWKYREYYPASPRIIDMQITKNE